MENKLREELEKILHKNLGVEDPDLNYDIGIEGFEKAVEEIETLINKVNKIDYEALVRANEVIAFLVNKLGGEVELTSDPHSGKYTLIVEDNPATLSKILKTKASKEEDEENTTKESR